MRLAWRAMRRLRGLPAFFGMAYETSLVPQWQDDAGRWRLQFRPASYAGQIGRGLARLAGRGAVRYRAASRREDGLRPTILHAIPNVFVGGSTQLIFDLCDALGDSFAMHILTTAVPRGRAHEGVPITVVAHDIAEDPLARQIADIAPHLIHVHYWGEADEPWYRTVMSAAKKAGVPIVQNVNTPVAAILDPAIAETIFVSDYVKTHFGAGCVPACVIHPGIELDRFEAPPSFDPPALDTIGMIYRLEPDKLRADAIDSLIAVCRARPRTRALVVGDGSLFAGFVARARTAGVRRQFWFTGAVPYRALPNYYRQFRVLVCPVWQESFGQVTPFAMSMGNAVAGNRIGALPEILQSDDTLGTDPNDTAARILALLADPARIEALGAENRSMARANFDVRAMTAAYDKVYRRVLGDDVDVMAGFPEARVFA